MAIDTTMALAMVKARLNRLPEDTTLDDYLLARIQAAEGELEAMGIQLTNTAEDMLLAVDYSVYAYQSRDKPGDQPDWLRRRIRYRWFQQQGVAT